MSFYIYCYVKYFRTIPLCVCSYGSNSNNFGNFFDNNNGGSIISKIFSTYFCVRSVIKRRLAAKILTFVYMSHNRVLVEVHNVIGGGTRSYFCYCLHF